jgi:histidinol-phosphate aminotransferase
MSRCVEEQPGCSFLKAYVPGKPIEEVQREYGIEDVIKLASNENPLGPSPKAVSAIRDALGRLNQYPDGQSYYLRHALAARLGVDPEQVAVGNGADGLIVQICLAYLDGASEVVVSECSFPIYDTYTHVMRAKLVKTPMRDYRFDLEAMASAINERTKLAFICNPNNPTGTIVTADEVEAFMERVPDHVLVVFDEAYFEFVDSDRYPDSLRYVREGRKNVLTLRTFSKSYGLAGLRLGYAIAEPEALAPLCKVKEPFTVNLLAQAGCIAALEDDEFLERSIATNRAERHFLYGEFGRLGLPYLESHANFVLVHLGAEAAEAYERMLTRGVIVRPCTGYGIPEYVRVTIGDHAQNLRLVRNLEEVLAEVVD